MAITEPNKLVSGVHDRISVVMHPPLLQVRIRLNVSCSGSVFSNCINELSKLAYEVTERNLHQATIVAKAGGARGPDAEREG